MREAVRSVAPLDTLEAAVVVAEERRAEERRVARCAVSRIRARLTSLGARLAAALCWRDQEDPGFGIDIPLIGVGVTRSARCGDGVSHEFVVSHEFGPSLLSARLRFGRCKRTREHARREQRCEDKHGMEVETDEGRRDVCGVSGGWSPGGLPSLTLDRLY